MANLTRWFRVVAFVVPAAVPTACQQAGGRYGASGPMLVTAADTIAFGRNVIINHGCGDCHGGGDNPGAPMWLMGFRPGTEDTLLWPFKVLTPTGAAFWTRPRNLTPDNETGTGRFTERQIFNALRYGLRPGETPDVDITGTTPGQGNFPENPKYLAPPMPWPAFRHMSDLELKAIAVYLKRGVKARTNKVEPSEGPPDFWAGLYDILNGPLQPPAFPTTQEAGTSK
ncbi:MAG: hypothetical protein ABIQ65_02065 [Thermoanaerobaculia bacterium]